MVRTAILFELSLYLKDKVFAAIIKLCLGLHFVFVGHNLVTPSSLVEFRVKNLQVVRRLVFFVAVSYCDVGRRPVT